MDTSSHHSKLYYTISEVSEMLNVNNSLIRFWEKEFPNQIKPKKNKNGKRMFTQVDIDVLKQIYYLTKEKGFTLAGAKSALGGKKVHIDKETQLKETLIRIKSFLLDIKKELNKESNA